MLRDLFQDHVPYNLYRRYQGLTFFGGLRLIFWVGWFLKTPLWNNESAGVIELDGANQVRDVDWEKYKNELFAD